MYDNEIQPEELWQLWHKKESSMSFISSFNEWKINENSEGLSELSKYYKEAEKAEKAKTIKDLDLSKGDVCFTFHHIKDDCDVTMYWDGDSHCVVIQQDYKNDKAQVAPDNDDISVDGFIRYVSDGDDAHQ